MKSVLKTVALIAIGWCGCVYFQFNINLKYQHVHQTTESADQTVLLFSAVPYHEMPPIDLFEK